MGYCTFQFVIGQNWNDMENFQCVYLNLLGLAKRDEKLILEDGILVGVLFSEGSRLPWRGVT